MMELFNIKFVQEVEKHPELYNYTIPEYSRKDYNDKAWNDIGKVVDMTAAECREKWRNIRSTFVKNQKPKLGGAGSKRKPYYLTEVMQFALPFIKIGGTPCSTLPDNSQKKAYTLTLDDSTMEISQTRTDHLFEETFSEEEAISAPSPNPAPSVSSMPHATPPQLVAPPESPGSSPLPESASSRPRVLHGPLVRRKRQRQIDAEKTFAEYLSTKKPKFGYMSQVDKREEGIKNFLMSQIPDLMQMNDWQLRAFKRKSLMLIDEILGAPPQEYTMQSYHVTDIMADPPISGTSGIRSSTEVYQKDMNTTIDHSEYTEPEEHPIKIESMDSPSPRA